MLFEVYAYLMMNQHFLAVGVIKNYSFGKLKIKMIMQLKLKVDGRIRIIVNQFLLYHSLKVSDWQQHAMVRFKS